MVSIVGPRHYPTHESEPIPPDQAVFCALKAITLRPMFWKNLAGIYKFVHSTIILRFRPHLQSLHYERAVPCKIFLSPAALPLWSG